MAGGADKGEGEGEGEEVIVGEFFFVKVFGMSGRRGYPRPGRCVSWDGWLF